MNILPKKRWHVRTKENIARVRKDEAEAAEKERQEQIRIDKADKEARLNILKNKSKERLLTYDIKPEETTPDIAPNKEHINLFEDLDHAVTTTNKEHDIEEKEKKEEYEKKIGYLTYLGQDTNEALKKKNWYEIPPGSSRLTESDKIKDSYDKLVLKDKDGKPKKREIDEKDGEIDWKSKQQHDPLNIFKEFCNGNEKVKKIAKCDDCPKLDDSTSKERANITKHRKDKGNSDNKLQKLREARIKREQQEKYRTEMFLCQLNGSPSPSSSQEKPNKVKPKYNSQFNPELARQNYR